MLKGKQLGCETVFDFEPPAAKLVWSQDLGAKLL